MTDEIIDKLEEIKHYQKKITAMSKNSEVIIFSSFCAYLLIEVIEAINKKTVECMVEELAIIEAEYPPK